MENPPLPHFPPPLTVASPKRGLVVFGSSSSSSSPQDFSCWPFCPEEFSLSQRGCLGGLFTASQKILAALKNSPSPSFSSLFQFPSPHPSSPWDPRTLQTARPAHVELSYNLLVRLHHDYPNLSPSYYFLLEFLGILNFSSFAPVGRHFPSRYGEVGLKIYSNDALWSELLKNPLIDKLKQYPIEISNFPSPLPAFSSLLSSSSSSVVLLDFSSFSSAPPVAPLLGEFLQNREKKYENIYFVQIHSQLIRKSIELSPISPMMEYSDTSAASQDFDPMAFQLIPFEFLPFYEEFPHFTRVDGKFDGKPLASLSSSRQEFSLGSSSLMEVGPLLSQIAYKIGQTGKYGA